MIVADTNLIAYLLIAGPFTMDAQRVLEIDEEWLAPPLWQSEFLNVLWLSVRTRVLSHALADEAYSEAEVLVRTAERPIPQRALALAVASGCSPYDCEFVVLAQATGAPLVTNDQKVLAAFPGVAVSLRGFGG
ncbi:MAG TPA: type II toxin-antitoxin system VapC family toxin [Longimicrobium sp.]